MVKLVGIGGSLRSGSYNFGLLRAAAELVPQGSTLEIHSIRGVPLYDADEESASGVPEVVTVLKEALAAADGLVFATPEYNNAMPGVLKNAIDWMSRPPADSPRVFRGKPVAIMGASPGGFGTILAQESWLAVLRTLGTRPWFGQKLYVSQAGQIFDDDGNLTDQKSRELLRDYLAAFVAAI